MDEPGPGKGFGGATRLSWRSWVVIALYGAGLFLVQFAPPDVLNYHEAFYGEPAREFLLSGDWVAPRIGGVPSWQKPPLSLWAMAASMAVFGTEAEWAVRLPTHLATVVTALAVAATAARWHGDRVGRLAGLVQLTTLCCLMQGRLAEPDMMLCATVAVAFALFAWAVLPGPAGARPPRRRWLGPAFFGVVGLSMMTKGPIGPVFIAGGCGLYTLWSRDRAGWRLLLDPVGWPVMLAVGLTWYVVAYFRDPFGFTWFLHINFVQRLRGGLGPPGETKGPFFYLIQVPLLLLPWTPLVGVGVRLGPREGARPAALERLLLCWFGVGLAVLSAASWKNKHYAIPVLPPLSVFAAHGLDRALSWRWRPWATWLVAAAAAGLVLGAVALLAVGRAVRVYQMELGPRSSPWRRRGSC
jgi:4-amino-4-deoxy-L-arabinose transferase-like glycosyltransferase